MQSCFKQAQMYVMEKKTDQDKTEKAKKRKALQEELTVAKKKKKELQRVAQQMVEEADKKANEAEKRKDTVGMNALMESNASRDKCKRTKEKDLPAQDKEIKEIEQNLKGLD